MTLNGPRCFSRVRVATPWSGGSAQSGFMPANLTTLLHFSVSLGNELPEVSGRARKHRGAHVGKPRPDLGVGKSGVDFPVEPADDFGGCVFGRAETLPQARLEARQEIAQGRDARQRL